MLPGLDIFTGGGAFQPSSSANSSAKGGNTGGLSLGNFGGTSEQSYTPLYVIAGLVVIGLIVWGLKK